MDTFLTLNRSGFEPYITEWNSNTSKPFNHVVIDNFLSEECLTAVTSEFPAFDSPNWYVYNNAIEDKKTTNVWDRFGSVTYQLFTYLNSPAFIRQLEVLTQCQLYPDYGLSGGGLHTHRRGGKLNTHLDYSTHSKLPLERRLNLIIYITPDWKDEWGGGLGLWSHDSEREQPKDLIKTVSPRYNRAVLFDTTQNSWHGVPEPLQCPDGITRNSLAIYYLNNLRSTTSHRQRALFAPTKEQEHDIAVQELIKRRAAGISYR